MEDILREFKSYYSRSLLNGVFVEPRKEQLRVSGFPYCGLRHAFKKITPQGHQLEDFGSVYYTSVGTVTHDLLQRHMGMSGQIYGNWKCLNPRCRNTVKFSCKSKCPKCKSQMKYTEIEVQAFKEVSGHLDGIFRSKTGKFYVIDYKTCSTRIIYGQRTKKTLPYKKNVAQIKAYCPLVERQLKAELGIKIKIAGWILLYVSRDTPSIALPVGETLSSDEKRKLLRKIKSYDEQFHLARDLTAKNIKLLVDRKPCKTHADYEAEYEDSLSRCPLAHNGVCFNQSLLRATLEDAWNDYKKKGITKQRST